MSICVQARRVKSLGECYVWSVWEWIINFTSHFEMYVITFAGVRRSSACLPCEQRVKNAPETCSTCDLRSTNVPRTYYNVSTHAHAAHTLVSWKGFVHVQKFFGGLACENVWWRVRTFPKRVQRSQNVWESCVDRVGRVTTCDKILPQAGHTLTPHV